MPITIPVAHDFICPWCWVGLLQARQLQREFGVKIEWLGYELLPLSLEETPSEHKPDKYPNKPPTLSRFALLLAAEGMALPPVPKPPKMKSYNAHQAVEYAKTEGVEDVLIEKIYRAFWEDGRDINKPEILAELAHGTVKDIDAMMDAIKTDRFDDKVVDFDEGAYATGVHNVPTFFIGDKRLAEQPYKVIQKTMAEFLGGEKRDIDLYSDIVFPGPHADRPYMFMNMVSTIDGKIITGERDEPVSDLGSDTDHMLMNRLETKADAVLVGANTLRATGNDWNPKTTTRIVVTKSGDVPWESKFLTMGEPIVITSEDATFDAHGVTLIRAGKTNLDWESALKQLRERGIDVVNVLGGSEINAQLLERELADELFLTLAPKIKLGSETPTYADGNPLPREAVQSYRLVSCEVVENEIFLRYQK